MGSELVIVRWCDRCKVKGDSVVEHRVRVDDVDRVLDLCPGCFDGVLVAVIEAITDLGQPAAAPTRTRASAETARARDTGDLDPRCKLCPHVSTTSKALKQHVRHKHDMGVPEYRAAAPRTDSALGQVAA